MIDKEKEIINNLCTDSLNLSRVLIGESTKLKLNMNTLYQNSINNYVMKQHKLYKFVRDFNCSSLDDIKLRRYILIIARSYDKVLYNKYLDMIELLYNRRYDEFESSSKKNNFSNRFSKKKYKFIRKIRLLKKSSEIKKNKKYIKDLFFSIFDNCDKVIKYDNELLNLYSKDFYDIDFINKSNVLLFKILD